MGKLIKAQREKLNLTQIEVAKHLGITNQFLSNIEREVCGIPLDLIPKLLEILKLDKHKVIDAMVEKFRKNIEKKILKKAK